MKIVVNRKDSIWSLIGIVCSMGANLIILPFILKYLNEDSVGLYYVFINIYAITALMDFGFGPNFARSIAYAWSGASELVSFGVTLEVKKEPNWELLQKIIQCCKLIYLGISLTALLIATSIGTIYVLSITKHFSGYSHMVSWCVFVLAIFLSLYYGYYGSLLRGIGAVAQINKATVFSRIVQIFICIFSLILGWGIIGVSVGYLLYGVCFRMIARKLFLGNSLVKQHIDKNATKIEISETISLIRVIWPNTWREGIITLSNYLLNQSTTLIASLSLSLYETGLYSLMIQLVSAVASIAGVFYTAYQPTLQSASANGDYAGQKKSVSIMVSSFVLLYAMGIAALVTIGLPLIKFIKPSYTINIGMLLLLSALYLLTRIRDCFCSYFAATNRLIYTASFIISAIISVVLALLFSYTFALGIWGLIAAQIISQLLFNIWYWPIKANRELRLNMKDIFIKGPKSLLNNLIHN